MTTAIEPITGRYVHLNVEGRDYRVYFEEAGQGIPLLCLHTAGADGRQWRAILNDEEITSNYRVLAFDLPWHGKSSPPEGFQREEYQLSTAFYIDTVLAFMDALGLDKVVVMGCSIGGRAVLHLSIRHHERFLAAVGLQSGSFAESIWASELMGLGILNRPDVNGDTIGATNSGVISPYAPLKHKWETLWHYMQGGPAVMAGDMFYYLGDGDLRGELEAGATTGDCALYLLSGEYDYSAPPAGAEEVSKQIKGATYTLMEQLGHFPMSEDPERFLAYLHPVLAKISATQTAGVAS